MTRPARPDVVRISAPADIVAAVPHLLGFHPAESLVAIGLRGPRARVPFPVRVDLPDGDDEPAVVETVAARMAAAKVDATVLVVFTDRAPVGGQLPHRRLA